MKNAEQTVQARFDISGPPHAVMVTAAELGVILIGMNSFRPNDHHKEFLALKRRLTQQLKRVNPDLYDRMIDAKQIDPTGNITLEGT